MRRSVSRSYTLGELAVYYSGPRSDAKPRRVGRGPWPFGWAWWSGVEGMAAVFTLKTFVFFGPLRLHAIRLRGLRAKQHRSELAGGPPKRAESTIEYGLRCLRLLLWGVPIGRVGQRVKLTKDDTERGVPAGTFGLIEGRR